MPRPRRDTIRIHVNVPAHILAIIDDHFYDPTHGKPRYGARNKLIVDLLTRHIRDNNLPVRKETEQPDA